MKVINLFAGPGSGKSTIAAGLFHQMKVKGMNCELVTEYAKDLVWDGAPASTFEDQFLVSAQQHHRILRLKNKVDYAIVDSPLLLGLHYMPEPYFQTFPSLLVEIFRSFDNKNFFIKRVKPYVPIGRNQTEQEAKCIDDEIIEILSYYRIEYSTIWGDNTALDQIWEILDS